MYHFTRPRLPRLREALRAAAQSAMPFHRAPRSREQHTIDLLMREIQAIRTHMGVYLGDNIALTHLADETPIFVNTNDYGPPVNYINGGIYESEVLAVLLSFVRDDTVFLDVGANLGFFSLQIARRLKGRGKVHAFEPHPRLCDLFRRSLHLNGLSRTVELHPHALSDENGTRDFFYPIGHLGSGSTDRDDCDVERLNLDIRRLDDVLDGSCDLIKLDVEGHELRVLRGMTGLIERSPRLKIVFENFESKYPTRKHEIEALLRKAGFQLYAIGGDAMLHRLAEGDLVRFAGYVLAIREDELGGMLNRQRFVIYPAQLSTYPESVIEQSRDRLCLAGPRGQTLFYGPYWYLPPGRWRLRLEGDLGKGVAMTIATRSSHIIDSFTLTNRRRERIFSSDYGLVQFETVGRSADNHAVVFVERVVLERVG